MTIIIIISIVVALVSTIVLWYFYAARRTATLLILTFLAESLLVRNIHPDKRPVYIISKCKRNTSSINWFVRPLSIWYLDHSGEAIASQLLRFIVLDLQEDDNIEIIQ